MTELRYYFNADGALRSASVPRYLFKFAAVNSYTLSSVCDHYLWFSRSSDFNDIFELPVKVRQDYSRTDLRSYLLANLPFHLKKFGVDVEPDRIDDILDRLQTEHPDMINKLFQAGAKIRRNLVRICCFSMCHDDPLMWAHYAANFTGICLVFDFPVLANSGPWFPVQVKYVAATHALDPVSTSLKFHASPRRYQDIAANVEYDQAVFGIKRSEWAHEKELRLCTLQSEPKQPYPANALLGIVLGPRISPEDELAVVEAADHPNCQRRIERLVVDENKGSITVPGLQNTCVEFAVTGFRNLSEEIGLINRDDK